MPEIALCAPEMQSDLIIFTFYKIPKCQLNLTSGIGSSPSCEQHLKLIILLTIISREVSEKGGYARDTCETRKIEGQEGKNDKRDKKIQSEMYVAPRYTLLC